MKSNKLVAMCMLYFVTSAAFAGADQKPKAPEPTIHIIRCSIDKVNQCLAQEAASGYVATHVAATIMDRPRTAASAGYGLMSSEDPVLVTQKSNGPKRQTIAIIDDLAKREAQINQAGSAGMRMVPQQLAVLRSWSAGVPQGGFGVARSSGGGVSVDGYAILFEEAQPSTRFEYKVIDTMDSAMSGKLKQLVAEGYRAVSIAAPSTLVLERSSGNTSKVDEYRMLRGSDVQRLGSELAKVAGEGLRVLSAAGSTTGLQTLVLLDRATDEESKIDYQVHSSYGAPELEKKLNDAVQNGYSPVLGGILPIITKATGRFDIPTPPQRVELIVGKNASPSYSAFKVLAAFAKDSQAGLDAAVSDGYRFVEFVSVMDGNFIVLGRPAQAAAFSKN